MLPSDSTGQKSLQTWNCWPATLLGYATPASDVMLNKMLLPRLNCRKLQSVMVWFGQIHLETGNVTCQSWHQSTRPHCCMTPSLPEKILSNLIVFFGLAAGSEDPRSDLATLSNPLDISGVWHWSKTLLFNVWTTSVSQLRNHRLLPTTQTTWQEK